MQVSFIKNIRAVRDRELSKKHKLKNENVKMMEEAYLLKKWQRYLEGRHQGDLHSSKDTRK